MKSNKTRYHVHVIRIIGFILVLLTLTGCKTETTSTEKIRDLEFTVLSKDELPKELMEQIESKKEEPFKFTYSDREYLYIVTGYGEQATGGYDIQVEELYLTSNAIYCDTALLGPKKDEEVQKVSSYPYIVLKTEFIDLRVVFD
ncbi:MAG TPA: protease complex subunit PrcB family protein [Lachnospiraceae bacterium]|jgi:hypothetical protein|nr:protease complex subunit PrcB family protein [Lachnospiraceae bacterium]